MTSTDHYVPKKHLEVENLINMMLPAVAFKSPTFRTPVSENSTIAKNSITSIPLLV